MTILELRLSQAKVKILEENLDQLQTKLWDVEDHNKLLLEKCQEQEIWVAQERSTRQSTQQQLVKALNELCEVRRNLTYAQNHIGEINKTIELAKKEMEKIRAAKVSDEHLARKLVELHNVNQKLVAENKQLDEENHSRIILGECHQQLAEEITKYQTQTTRLIAENAAHSCSGSKTNEISAMCGGCTECQLKQAKSILTQTASNLTDANAALAEQRKILDEKTGLIATLNQENDQAIQLIQTLEAGLREIGVGKQWFTSSATLARSTLAKANLLPGNLLSVKCSSGGDKTKK